jgi:hypothetical protein
MGSSGDLFGSNLLGERNSKHLELTETPLKFQEDEAAPDDLVQEKAAPSVSRNISTVGLTTYFQRTSSEDKRYVENHRAAFKRNWKNQCLS